MFGIVTRSIPRTTAAASSQASLVSCRSQSTSELSFASGIDKGKQKEAEIRPPSGSIYENSRAALRPRANTRSTLFAKRPKKAEGQLYRRRGQQQELDDDSILSASLNAALDTPLARSDESLRLLYIRLARETSERNAIDCLRVCTLIKGKLQQLSPPGSSSTSPPIFVYHMLLKRLSSVGAYTFCREIGRDMQVIGHSIEIKMLESYLQAAVVSENEEGIEETLQEIAAFGRQRDDQMAPSLSMSSAHRSILSAGWTRNWTPAIYRSMIHWARVSHKLEFALLLLGSASQRQREGGDEASFLTMVFTHATVVELIYLVTNAREARLAVELAQWLDNGIAARKLSPQSWMTVLTCCAWEAYFPGIKIAWDGAIDRGLLVPDDGLVTLVLNAAAQEGDVAFIERVLAMHKDRLVQAHMSLQEWHLVPLLEAHCVNYDFVKAIRVATHLSKTYEVPITQRTLMSLLRHASTSSERLEEAVAACIEVGRDTSEEGGVCIAVLNALMGAALRVRDQMTALKLFRYRHFLRNEKAPSGISLPAVVSPFFGESEAEFIERDDHEKDGKVITSVHTLRADVDTYNAALYAANLAESYSLGQAILRQLNAEKVAGDAMTYERAIRLELSYTKKDYQDAFRLLEECKKRNLIPTYWSYYHIGMRCVKENDSRWIRIGKEMAEYDLGPEGELYRRMVEGGHMERRQY